MSQVVGQLKAMIESSVKIIDIKPSRSRDIDDANIGSVVLVGCHDVKLLSCLIGRATDRQS